MSDSYSVIVYKSTKLPKQYHGLIFSRWLRSFRLGNAFLKKAEPGSYYRHYQKYLEILLSKPESEVRLAVLTDDHDNVLGFSVTRGEILDYVHVQFNHRRHGIAKKLIPEAITTITHTTKLAIGILRNNDHYHFKFDPFI